MADELVYTTYNGKARWVVRMEEETECPEAEGGTANFTIDGPASSIDVCA